MAASLPPLDERLLALMLHDLRNPLNGIFVSWSYLESELAADPRDGISDCLRIVGDCARQSHAMLALLTDYFQLTRTPTLSATTAINPHAFLAAIIEERYRRRIGRPRNPVTLNIAQAGPATVPIHAELARIAARIALENALNTAGAAARVRIDAGWNDQRWRTAFVIDEEKPPASEPASRHPLRFDQPCEQLLGNAKQRHGLDLVLVAWISDQLKGRAYLKSTPGQPGTIVLDWPVPAAAASDIQAAEIS